MKAQTFDDLIPSMKRAGFVATALAAVITAKFGYALGEDTVSKLALGGLLALCTFIVGYSLVAAWHAYDRGLRPVGHAAVALFAIAICVEFLSHTGFTAANRDGSIQDAVHKTSTASDARKHVADLERALARLEAKHDWQKSYDPPTSYDERIAAKKESADRELTRGGCGKKCEGLKAEHASLVAERAIASDRIAVAEEIKQTKKELADARAQAASTQTGHAAGASQGVILASMLTFDDKPNQKATFWAGVGISALLALFAIAAGGLLNFIAFAFDGINRATGSRLDPRVVERIETHYLGAGKVVIPA